MDGENPLDKAVAAWLIAKYARSRSDQTFESYGRGIRDFRTFLRLHGHDLDPYAGLPGDATDADRRRAVTDFAELIRQYACYSKRGRVIAATSYNRRLSMVSSFYDFAARHDYVFCGNPVDKLSRTQTQHYRSSRTLDINEVARRMQAMDRSSLRGARNYAMLSVFLETGRRASEVLNLHWRHVRRRGDGRMELLFERTKGGESRRNILTVATSQAIMTWLDKAYPRGVGLVAETPLWPGLNRASPLKKPLLASDVREICRKILGVSNLHRLRHTFAYAMRKAGASLEEVQQALGHKSVATTEIYVRALEEPENAHIDTVAGLLGLTLECPQEL